MTAVGDDLDLDVSSARRCRGCGCTDEFACGPNGCTWVEPDLCSACDDQDDPQIFHSHKLATPLYAQDVVPRRVA